MSHIVTIQTRVRDAAGVRAACARLRLAAPEAGTARLYSGTVAGLLVKLPDWTFPVVVDVATGTLHYDHFNGEWGNIDHLHAFLQAYAVETARLEAHKKGYACTEQLLADGSIKLQIQEGA